MYTPSQKKRKTVTLRAKKKKTGSGTKIPKSIIGGSNTFLPRKRTYKFQYSDMIAVSSLAFGTYQGHAFNGNGLYDPDDTGTGHQPRGFDQIKALYRTYRVTASSIRVRFCNLSAGSGSLCGLYADSSSDSNPTTADIYDFLEIYKNNVVLTNTDGSRATAELTDDRKSGKYVAVAYSSVE